MQRPCRAAPHALVVGGCRALVAVVLSVLLSTAASLAPGSGNITIRSAGGGGATSRPRRGGNWSAALLVAALAAMLVGPGIVWAALPADVVIDFSSVGSGGPFASDQFASAGIVF